VHLSRLALTDFRSYAAVEVRLEPGVTVFTGPNGEGKTNLVEAIGYVATLGSHRVATDAPLIRSGAERAIVRAGVTSAVNDSLVEIEINAGRPNRVRLNRAPLPRPRQILGVLLAVVFAPEDLALVKGDPAERRRLLDDLLVATAPRYAGVRADYDRVLRQRTALLKSAGAHRSARGFTGGRPPGQAPRGFTGGRPPGQALSNSMTATLDAWDDQLARTGAELLAGRVGLVGELRPFIMKSYAAVSGDRGLATVAYRQRLPGGTTPQHPPQRALPGGTTPQYPPQRALPQASPGEDEPSADQGELEAGLREALAKARQAELDRGVCLVGPHRDDLELRIGDLPARGYASHGESWSLALALRLAGHELLRCSGEDPVLLLDDVFAELDTGRRDRLASLVADAEQVLVTAAVPADVPAVLTGARFDVANGVISRVT